MTKTYRAFGHALISDMELQGVVEGVCASAPAIRIRLRSAADAPTGAPVDRFFAFEPRGPREAILAWRGVGTFVCRDGAEIDVHPLDGADPFLLQQPLLGPVMAVLLGQRGFGVLHGSAVGIGGRAALVLADSGTGKSTLAAALVGRGATFVSDDLCVLRREANGWTILPEVPRIKLTRDSSARLGPGHGALPAIPGEADKGEWRLPSMAEESLPVGAVFVYEAGTAVAAGPLAPGPAFVALRTHTFARRLLGPMGADAESFRTCGELARELAVHRLVRSGDFSALDAVAALVEAATLPREAAPAR